MNQKLKTICYTLLLALAIVSCKDEGSIQTYVVDHQDRPEFLTLDLSPKMVDLSQAELSEEELEVYNSFEKISIIAYKTTNGDDESYTREFEKAKAVFKNEKYEELMEFSDSGFKFRVNTIGNDDTVDEFLVLASSRETGFAVVRVLGDNMKPEELYKLMDQMKNADVDGSQLDKLMDYFKE
ncbi:DUF4252 domain-containing protein [uncultured Lacinutrix sp.]|uniref:DUF4252 domain-containing protein n=1 Tax=uncultured Lacinutrix sp. TaxID=574032 RepID=UPI00260B01EC|nr:DUF4252 domain-containing protein [uncultured Lacinutrix sp.]